MAKKKDKGPLLGATLIQVIEINGETIDMPTYDDLMATHGRSTRGHRIVKGYEALLIALSEQVKYGP